MTMISLVIRRFLILIIVVRLRISAVSTRLSVSVRLQRSNSRSLLQLVCARLVGKSPKQAKQKWDARGLVKRVVAEKERAASSPPQVSVFASVLTNSRHAHYYLGVWNSLWSSSTDWTNPANRLYGLIAFRSRHKEQLSSEDDWWRKVALFFCPINGSFSHDVTAAIGAWNNETAAMLVYRKILWVFSNAKKKTFFCFKKFT